jgi:hypothetical protein
MRHGSEASHNLSPLPLGVDRAKITLVRLDGGIGVDPDEERVNDLGSLGEVLHVPGVQEVKHPRGEPYCPSRFAVFIPEPNRFFSADR